MNISILHTIVAVVYIILIVTEKADDNIKPNISIRIARPENFVTLTSMHLYDCQPIETETDNRYSSCVEYPIYRHSSFFVWRLDSNLSASRQVIVWFLPWVWRHSYLGILTIADNGFANILQTAFSSSALAS